MSASGSQRAAEAAQDLYALPPADFTGERDRMVREARDAGDRELAAALKGLRRPVVAAWAVNLLVREEPDLVRQVLDIGQALREAQEGLEGDALRQLGRQRRDLIASVVSRARDLVRDHGGSLAGQAEQQVGATLQAALADSAAAEAVMTGLLVKPLEPGGMPDLRDHLAGGATRSRSATTAPRGAAGADESQAEVARLSEERRRLRREAAEQRLADAEQAAAEAESALAHARSHHEEAHAHLLHLEARIDELRRQVSALESEAETACERVEGAEEAVTDAEAAVEDATSDLSAARQEVTDLG